MFKWLIPKPELYQCKKCGHLISRLDLINNNNSCNKQECNSKEFKVISRFWF